MNKLSNAGQMTLDFIFAFVLVMGLTGILFSLSLSLTVSSITQYITYASARNYFASHLRSEDQYAEATKKFTELVENPAFSTLYSGDWFKLDPFVPRGSNTGGVPAEQIHQRFPDYNTSGEVVNKFMGVGADLTARMLDFRIPFFGSTNPESQTKGDGFNAFLSSYMPIEPSQQLCIQFLKKKWDGIKSLHESYQRANVDPKDLSDIYDNGC